MRAISTHKVTALLLAWRDGDRAALDQLTPIVYAELHRMAKRYMGGERTGHTLQPTALVNEVYLRLVDANQMRWENRAHFFAICAQLMRNILVDFARSRKNFKRGGNLFQVSLDKAMLVAEKMDGDLVALDDALKALTELDERKGRVVELRFFGGLSVDETAEVLQVSADTVGRDWRLAKSWLHRELSKGGG